MISVSFGEPRRDVAGTQTLADRFGVITTVAQHTIRTMAQSSSLERLSTQASFIMGRLEHGYYLQFADRISRIYHEFGERGVQDKELTRAIAEKKYEQALTYGTIIDALTRLAGCPEASADDLNSLTPAAFNDGFRDDMTVGEYRKAREKGQIL